MKNLYKFNLYLLFYLILSLSFILFFYHLDENNSKYNKNEVPYISTYYIKPVVSPLEDVVIDFYITDYYHKEYLNDDYSNTFTVYINLNGNPYLKIKNLKAGDNSINIGKFKTIGEITFSIYCTDSYNRSSHELFNSFLVKDTITYNEYIMTIDDLNKYNISNSDNINNAINTGEGLQKLLDDTYKSGYNKLIMLPGIYRIDYKTTLFIPSNFTLDMNSSTIKLNGFTGDKALMLTLNNTFDSHVINGTLDGDYYDHDYDNSPNNSEWIVGITIDGESKYSSVENMTIKNITGYGAGNSIAYSRYEDKNYTYYPPTPIGNTFQSGDIDKKTGSSIPSECRTTSDFIDISKYSVPGYLSVSRYLGYQGNSCDTWNIICHFYDNNKKYLTSIDSYQYRIIKVPINSTYMKVTILNNSYPDDLSVQLFRVPTNCSFKNIKFENCRAVGLAQSAMKNMLVDNCEFINCGQVLAKCAYLAEDGADMMQDVTLRNLTFHNNPNNELLTSSGHNFIIENIESSKFYFWDRTNSYVVRNCNNITSSHLKTSSRCRTGYVRFYNNTLTEGISINSVDASNWSIAVKNCSIYGRAECSSNNYFIKCNISESLTSTESFQNSLGAGNFLNCIIENKSGSHNYGGYYYNCTLNNIYGNLQNTFIFKNCTINNFNGIGSGDSSSYKFENCTLNNFQINFGYWFLGATILIKNCTINNSDYLLRIPHYSLKYPISLINNSITSDGSEGIIIFYDDRFPDNNNDYSNSSELKLINNTICCKNSIYVITGLTKNTCNKITIRLKDNDYSTNTLSEYDSQIDTCANIYIKK